jgi:hypothetical protein
MLVKLAASATLLALCVTIHAASLTVVLSRMSADLRSGGDGPLAGTWVLIRVAAWLILSHLIQIAVWAAFYRWRGCVPEFESAFYFSMITYTTVGYGDIVLADQWRLLSGVEALTGILMCGLSTGVFFAVVSRLHLRRESGLNSSG